MKALQRIILISQIGNVPPENILYSNLYELRHTSAHACVYTQIRTLLIRSPVG